MCHRTGLLGLAEVRRASAFSPNLVSNAGDLPPLQLFLLTASRFPPHHFYLLVEDSNLSPTVEVLAELRVRARLWHSIHWRCNYGHIRLNSLCRPLGAATALLEMSGQSFGF